MSLPPTNNVVTFLIFRQTFKINVVIDGVSSNYQCSQHFYFSKKFKIIVVNIFLLFRKSSKSVSSSKEAKLKIIVDKKNYFFEKSPKLMLSSMEAKPNINAVNNFYIFQKISKSMSPSREAKPNINVATIFTFSKKVQNQCHHQLGKIKYQCSQKNFFFEKSSKLMSSSMETKPKINVINIF
jgi:hypothetical protein